MRSVLIALASLLLFASCLFAYDRGVWQKNEEAISLIKNQQFRSALKLLLDASKEMPGNQVLRKNAATAYIGIGQQQLHEGTFEQAAETFQHAKEYNDEESRIWLLRGVALLRSGHSGEAESELNEAWAMSGDEPRVLMYLGQLYYETDRMYEAVDIWRRALSVDADNVAVKSSLEKAERELAVEKELDRSYSGHFILSYAENTQSPFGGDLLDVLEEAYTWAGAKLSYYPQRQTQVILYTQRQFRGLTGSPEWATGVYDGKIRLSIKGISRVDAAVSALLVHEFMHVIVRDMAGNRVPYWLNEGLAEVAARQWHDAAMLDLTIAKAEDRLLRLESLAGSFRGINPSQIKLAYEQSYSFVRFLIDRFGWYEMSEVLPLIKQGVSVEDAFNRVYGDYATGLDLLEKEWRNQL